MWISQIARFISLYALLTGCEKQQVLQHAQAHNIAPVQAVNCVMSDDVLERGPKTTQAADQSHGNGYCMYSSVTGPSKLPLMVAIWQSDVETVKKLINTIPSLNVLVPLDCNDRGKKAQTTPLLHAIEAADASRFRSRSEAMVQFLIEQGADANFRASQGVGPLQMAASLGDLSPNITRILLNHGARVNDRQDDGETALLISAQRENGPVVIPDLVAAGADIRAVNPSGHNALMLAAWQHYKDTVILLARMGVDACAVDKDGKTAIDLAKANLNDDPGKQEIITFLQEKCGR